MNHGSGPSWERLVFWLVAMVIGLQVLSAVLPRLLVPLTVLAGVAGLLRLVWFLTDRRL
jgi:hypothetical protein